MWNFHNNTPIYLQIVDEIKMQIISGNWKPGEKIASVREIAQEAGVNPNTVQRALSELERHELLFAQRTNGRFVTEDAEMIKNIRREVATQKMKETLEALLQMGYTPKELEEIVSVYLEDRESA
ncbi:GntR family transcriptional regulator [Acetivibrio sp. MSJd-27]|uniref:GntR family transcriptional regulator n=1 Tax=Acetivibrio sp. MSJd-27 TaxID=2841523 RepID=UPI0027E08001|nr:GntR family transcriptional regulator [Acetivibrio sp. MSJd-27]